MIEYILLFTAISLNLHSVQVDLFIVQPVSDRESGVS